MIHAARTRRNGFDSPRTRTATARPDIVLGAVLALFLGLPVPGAAQSSPEDVAADFYDAVATHAWTRAATALHPEALDLFVYRLTAMLAADTTGSLSDLVSGPEGSVPMSARSPASVFAALLRAIEADTPGLIAVLATNAYDPVGHVTEGVDLSHVVFRITPYTNGSAPTRTALVTLKRTGSGWGILESDALDSLATAMTGLSITARTPSHPRSP